jgi:hypothetical protein
MRYGLISNFRRSWSKIGERTMIDKQQSFENRYLFSAVAPIELSLIFGDGLMGQAAANLA